MTAANVNLNDLSAVEKLALMERLWDSLAADDHLEPPDWHGQILADREGEWKERHTAAEDWEDAKREIRAGLG